MGKDLPLHRYNCALPPCYKNRIQQESYEQLFALKSLASSISQDMDRVDSTYLDGNSSTKSDKHSPAIKNMESMDQASVWDQSDIDPIQHTINNFKWIGEGYGKSIERDLAVFEKGLARFLDLKYIWDAPDYSVFVRVMIRGAIAKNIDLGLRSKLARTLIRVLRKRDCLLDFGLPWREFLKILKEVHLDCARGGPFIGKDVRDSHCRNIITLFRKSRNFLPPKDNAETLWNEFGKQISIRSPEDAFEPLMILSHLMPTRGDAWCGWLDQAVEMWRKMETSSDWDTLWMGLLARVSRHQPCIVDWTPYLGIVYEHIPSIFRLPLGHAAPQSPVERRCPAHFVFFLNDKITVSAADFCVFSLSPRSPEAMLYLRKLVVLINNYFHPSNNGKWSSYLGSFLGHFTNSLITRISEERAVTKAGINTRIIGTNAIKPCAPLEDRLTDDIITDIVDLLLPLIRLGLHSKASYMAIQAAASARDLAAITPDPITLQLLNTSMDSLISAITPHRTSAGLKMLATLTPVFLDVDLFPNGYDFLPQALELTLPGIDANDPAKTEATFRFIAGAAARISSSGVRSQFLDDYTHELLDRIFGLLGTMEAPPKKSRSGSSGYSSISPFIFSIAMRNYFSALPLSVAMSASERIAREVSGAAVMNAMKFFGILVRTCISAVSESAKFSTSELDKKTSAAGLFLPLLLNQIVDEPDHPTKEAPVALSSLSEEELVWRLRMLAQACRECEDLLPYTDKILEACFLAMKHSSRPVYKAGGRLLRGLLQGLSAIKLNVGCCEEKDSEWSEKTSESITWYEPSEADWTVAISVLVKALHQAEALATGNDISFDTSQFNENGMDIDKDLYDDLKIVTDRDKLFRCLRLLHAIQRGGRWILAGALSDKLQKLSDKFEKNPESLTKEELKALLRKPVFGGLGGEVTTPIKAETSLKLWNRTYSLISKIVDAVVAERPDDGSLLYRCLEPIELGHEPFHRSNVGRLTAHAARGYKTAYEPVVSVKREYRLPGGIGRGMPLFIKKLRVEALHETRLSMGAHGGLACDSVYQKIIKQLTQLSINDFPNVRMEARGALTRAFRIAPTWVRRAEVLKLIDTLNNVCQVGKSSGNATEVATNGEKTEDMDTKDSVVTTITKATEDKDQELDYEKIIGLADVLRSSSVMPYVTREWPYFTRLCFPLLKALFLAERADGAAMIGVLFAKLISMIRPLNVSVLVFPDEDFEFKSKNNGVPHGAHTHSLYSEYQKFCNDILELTKSKEHALAGSNWRLQSFVAALLYVIMRTDFPPPLSVVAFFTENLASEVVSLRQVSIKAVSLIIAFLKYWSEEDSVEIRKAMEEILVKEGFFKKTVHTLALDQTDDTNENNNGGGDSIYSLGGLSLLSLAKNVDGDACWVLVAGYPWPASWIPRSRDALGITRVRLYESLFRTFGQQLHPLLENVLVPLINLEEKVEGVTEENCRIICTELLTGTARGLKVSDTSEVVVQNYMQWTQKMLDNLTGYEGMVNGGTMLRMISTSDEDVVAREIITRVRDDLFKVPIIEVTSSAQNQARKLRYMHSTIADMCPDDPAVDQYVKLATEALQGSEVFAHPLKQVREEIARCLSLLSSFSSKGAFDSMSEAINNIGNRLKPSSNYVLDTEDEEAKKKRSCEGETLSRWISVVHWNGDTHLFSTHLATVLPGIFASLDESDPDRVSHARLALSLAAQTKINDKTADKIISVCEDVARSERWRIRGSVLPFLQVVAFTRMFGISEKMTSRIRDIMLMLLKDEQLEVREGAALTLIPMLRDAPETVKDEIRNKFLSALKNSDPVLRKFVNELGRPRSRERPHLENSKIVERHCTVLGLSCFIMSSPYSVPEWMPGVLLALTGCISDPPPISTSVKKLFAEFWRTHRDEWNIHKNAFTSDELECVSELLISPSYYA